MGEAELAYEKALVFLEKRDRTEREIADRLYRAGFTPEVVAETVERLRDAGYVDDADYAERYLEALAGKGRGRLRIAAEMRRKGLTDELVRNVIEDGISTEDERERALGAARVARAGIPAEMDSNKAMAKVSRRLVSLGFSYDVIGEVMNALRKDSIGKE